MSQYYDAGGRSQNLTYHESILGSTESHAPMALNLDMISQTMNKLAKDMDIGHVDQGALAYLAQATQSRLLHLISAMVEASQHRVHSQVVDPILANLSSQSPCKISDVQDMKKQLAAIDRVEREEERQRKRVISERERQANNSSDDGDDMEDVDDNNKVASAGAISSSGAAKKKKKKKKKDGPPGTAGRDVANDSLKKSTNETALMLAGGVRKSWMMTMDDGSGGDGSGSGHFSTSVPSSSGAKDVSTLKNRLPSQESIDTTDSTGNADSRGERGRPRGRKSESTKRGRGASNLSRHDSSSLLLSTFHGRSGIGTEANNRRITVQDAIYALERELEQGCESGEKTFLRTFNRVLK
ncbi:hypothetical protein BC940DRAFT_351035 [Gongronella butleri]|nr:hypothetical protein BC940DRAFT_351035 [Gongronella butleri]